MKRLPCIFLFAALGAVISAEPLAINRDSIKTFYRQFPKLTKEPVRVGEIMTISCVGIPFPREVRQQEKKTGPHTEALVHYYTNEQAQVVYRSHQYPFPVGSVVVKEKLDRDGVVIGIGGMRKRESGFNSAHGDWEFFYTDARTGFQIGGLQHCAECHAAAKASDYVFTVARPPTEPKKATK